KRLTIGLPDIIEHANRERFTEFWNDWYQPERMVIVAVGDLDPALVERLIVSQFSSLVARAPARPDPVIGKVPEFEGVRTFFHAEPEASETSVSIMTVRPVSDQPDSVAKRLEDLPRLLAVSMLNQRFSRLARKEGAPFSHAR